MAYERGLYIGRKGQLLSIRAGDELTEDSYWGHTCDCCGISCTPEGLKDAPHGLWRFEVKPGLERQFDVQSRREEWAWKRHPKLMGRLAEKCEIPDSIYWLYEPCDLEVRRIRAARRRKRSFSAARAGSAS